MMIVVWGMLVIILAAVLMCLIWIKTEVEDPEEDITDRIHDMRKKEDEE